MKTTYAFDVNANFKLHFWEISYIDATFGTDNPMQTYLE